MIAKERERKERSIVGERRGRGGKERTNLPLLRELHVHVARAGEPDGETAEERESGREGERLKEKRTTEERESD